jgi:hypothetical protein
MNEIIMLDGREFLVVERVNFFGYNYIYAYALDDTNDYTILRETVTDGKKFVTSVTDDEEIEEILKMIAKVDEVK